MFFFYPSAQPYCHRNTVPLAFAFPSVGRKTFPTPTYVQVIGGLRIN